MEIEGGEESLGLGTELLLLFRALLVLTEESIEVSQDRGAGERPIFRIGMGEIKSVKSNKTKEMKKHAFV